MKKLTFFLIGINFITFAAHFSRAGMGLLSILVLILPFILLYKKKISLQIVQAVMVLAGIEWIRTAYQYITQRMDTGEPWLRLSMILSVVIISAFWSAFLLNCDQIKDTYK